MMRLILILALLFSFGCYKNSNTLLIDLKSNQVSYLMGCVDGIVPLFKSTLKDQYDDKMNENLYKHCINTTINYGNSYK